MHKLGCDLKKVQFRKGGFRASGKSVVAFGEGPKFCFILYTISFFDTHAIIHVNVNQIEEYILRNGDDT